MKIFSFHCCGKDAKPEWLKDRTFFPVAGNGNAYRKTKRSQIVAVSVVVVVLLIFLLLLLLLPIRSKWSASLGWHLRHAPSHIHW